MVRGVNKTVIEINDTGSVIFDKVVLFVSPQYGNISTKRLTSEAQNFIGKLESELCQNRGVRQRFKNRRIIRTVISVSAAAVFAAIALIIIL